MKRPLALAALLSVVTSVAQVPDYNRFALEAQLGLNNPVSPMADHYDSQTFGFFHTALGARYMLNPRAGVRLSVGYDQFTGTGGSLPFTTNYLRVSGEGVINMGNLLQFSQWTDRFGLLLHAGMGYSTMKGKSSSEGWDQMLHAMIGITPQLRLNDRLALSVDLTVLAHAYQSRTYDFSRRNHNPGVDGYLYNLSFGIQYAFGNKRMYADWVPTPDLTQELGNDRIRIQQLEEQLKDDDGDGVANYLDQEPGTVAGSVVNTKGQTQPKAAVILDTDSDGVTDERDLCPTIKGKVELNGCPDSDGDGIADHLDNCPALFGVASNNGCPEIKEKTKKIFEQALKGIQFETAKDVLVKSSYPVLNDIVKILQENPDYKLEITGHTDNQGEAVANQLLSEQRAMAVKQYLMSKGIGESRLTTRGMGDTEPVAGNDSATGRAENRRVAFIVKF